VTASTSTSISRIERPLPLHRGADDDRVPLMLEVGRIGRAHGVKGAVFVALSTDRVERVAPGSRLFDGTDWLTVESSRSQPAGRFVVQFAGLTDRNEAERLTGRILSAEPLDDPDALWIHELIGAKVVDADGVERGVVTSVIANPAHDILELDTGHLVPIIFVTGMSEGVAHVTAPVGLFDLLD
jgi:16S rRNA processing protein RimM